MGLSTEAERRTKRDEINRVFTEWAADRDTDSVVELLQSIGVPAGKVQNADDLINEDPQLAARGFWRDVTHDVFGDRTIDTFPALWNGRRLPASALSPSYLGEHNFEVWTQLAGLDFEEVAEGVGNGLFN
jgi:benzylsuccinate CoA-transferase BbsF subunit